MRPLFAPAIVALALVALPAGAFERNELLPGDTAVGDVLVPGTFDEYPIVCARGSFLTLTIGKAGAGGYQPALGLYNDEYAAVSIVGIGPTTVRNELPLPPGRYRVIVAGRDGTVGAYRLQTKVQPARTFSMAATAEAPASTLTFGAYADYEAAVTIRWKGPAPVTLVSVTDPSGAPVVSAEAPVTKGSASTQRGFRTTLVGDHVVTLDVPPGTLKWSATVQLAGRLPRGTSRDFRAPTPREPVTVTFPSLGRAPLATIVGETGGPNDCLLTSRAPAPGGTTVPDASFIDGGAGTGGCSRAPRGRADPPTEYLVFCTNGFFVDVTNVERDETGLVTGFEAPSIRTPQGSGSAKLSGFTYDASGRPTGWTEVRRFDASGRSYELVFSRAAYFASNGYCKEFRVVERLLPDGPERTYDYAPLR